MIITISGQAGSGKSTAAKLLAKKLRMKHYSVGDLRRKMALERGMTLAQLNRLGEKEIFTDKEADDYQRELGRKEDNFVIDGRLSFHFIPHSVKIFLTADLKVRTKRVFSDERKTEKFHSLEEVEKALVEREKSDIKRYKKYYGINSFDTKYYDLVIDTTRLGPNQVVEKIIKFLKERKKM